MWVVSIIGGSFTHYTTMPDLLYHSGGICWMTQSREGVQHPAISLQVFCLGPPGEANALHPLSVTVWQQLSYPHQNFKQNSERQAEHRAGQAPPGLQRNLPAACKRGRRPRAARLPVTQCWLPHPQPSEKTTSIFLDVSSKCYRAIVGLATLSSNFRLALPWLFQTQLLFL